VFVPNTPEIFTYHADGNLLSDGRWNYTWDAENRLVKVESRSDTPQGSWRRVEWQYDALGRRIRQTTWSWLVQSNLWAVTEDVRMVSDPLLFGRHLLELNATNVLARSYVRGLDLSGTLEGAGGVGGLLWVTLHTASGPAAGTQFAAYDGNGNIVALSAASDGSATARYEYGPFGEPIRITGPAAALKPFRFSTKRTDPTTDLVLYEYRVYNPSAGRWLCRDPLGEEDGAARYVFVAQEPVNHWDYPGLRISKREATPPIVEGSVVWNSVEAEPRSSATVPVGRPWPDYKPAHTPTPSSIRLCRRKILMEGGSCVDRCVIRMGNALSGHIYLDYGYDSSGRRRGIGCRDPNAKAGDKPKAEDDLDICPPIRCVTCLKVGSELQYGGAKGKRGSAASNDELWECVQKAPIEREYNGMLYNCRHWAQSAARRCGLLCGAL
jgi:RHS repeat-associated protein